MSYSPRRPPDTTINGVLRNNILSLRTMIRKLPASPLRDELTLIAETEESVTERLRMICEDLHPTPLSDPFGFAAVVRIKAERVLLFWRGTCTVEEKNRPVIMSPELQREATRIVGEALTNIVKHAEAEHITVKITYPAEDTQPLQVEISDDGIGYRQLRPVPGHRGLRDMRRRARLLRGSLELQSQPGHGTTVKLRCPVETFEVADREDELD